MCLAGEILTVPVASQSMVNNVNINIFISQTIKPHGPSDTNLCVPTTSPIPPRECISAMKTGAA